MTGRCFRFPDEVRDVSSRGQLEAGECLREGGVEDSGLSKNVEEVRSEGVMCC